jgi:chromosome partitioning protein
MILCVAHIKGGVGKTLVATSIAAVLAQRGRDVLLIDADDQASAATFAQIRAELAGLAAFTTVQLYGAAIRQQMKPLREKYAEIVIDVGGRDTGSLRAALTVAHKVALPFLPRSVDLWAGAKIAALVREARELNEGMRAYAFLNMADSQGRDNADAFEALQAMAGITPLPLAMVRRKAFPNAFSGGLCVTEQTPRDAKAVEELLAVVDALYAQEGDNGHQDAAAAGRARQRP